MNLHSVISKYQWPASRLTQEEMGILYQIRKETKQSICELLRKAVHMAYKDRVDRAKAKDGRI